MFHIPRFRITSRHAASAVAVAASVYFSFSQLQNEHRRQERDLELSSLLLADSLREAVEPLLSQGAQDRLSILAERFGRRGRLSGIAVFDREGALLAGTRSLRPSLRPTPQTVVECLRLERGSSAYEAMGGTRMRVTALPLHEKHGAVGAVAVFHDLDFIEARMVRSHLTNARRMALQAVIFLIAIWTFGLFFR